MKIEQKRCTARGNQVKDTGTGAPTEAKLGDGQLADHFVLCPADLAKGYVEPYRESYLHVGPPGPTHPLVDVDAAYRAALDYELDPDWVKFEAYPEGSHGRGKYWTQNQLDKAGKGCGTLTRMPRACAETYAAQPGYYGSTFCCGCNAYFPVGRDGEFVWDTVHNQRVGTRRAPPSEPTA